ncbi:MAG: aminotransferase class III-fold pyridoxal phosphate-dependent enzyme [Acetobacteraceae bacterium]
MVDGFDHVPFGNMNAVRDAIGPQTAGIIVEPIQGEGGVRPASLQFLRDLRAALRRNGILLGMGRGPMRHGPHRQALRHEWAGITPDVMSVAKGMRGFPMGAVLAREAVAKYLVAGTHERRLAATPWRAAANAVLDVILAPGLPGGSGRARGVCCGTNWKASWPRSLRCSRRCGAPG